MDWLKQIGTEQNCINFFKYIYKGYGRKRQLNLYWQKEILDDFNNPITILVPKPLVTIKTEDIMFLSVFAREIERLKDKGQEEDLRKL